MTFATFHMPYHSHVCNSFTEHIFAIILYASIPRMVHISTIGFCILANWTGCKTFLVVLKTLPAAQADSLVCQKRQVFTWCSYLSLVQPWLNVNDCPAIKDVDEETWGR